MEARRSLRAWPGIALLALLGRGAAALDDVSKQVVDERTPVGGGGFVRADANADGSTDISDAIFILGYLFLGTGTPTCLEALNVDDSPAIDISDSIYLLGHLFLGGPPPLPPVGACGADPTPGLGCASFPPCGGDAWRVRLVNRSETEVLAPLIAVIDSIGGEGVIVEDPDGTREGKPFFEYTSALPGGSLAAGGRTPERLWNFRNPLGKPFQFTVKVLASQGGGGGWLPAGDPLGEGRPAPRRKPGRIDPNIVEYAVQVPGIPFRPVSEEPGRFEALSLPFGGHLGDVGRPAVPTFTQLVAVPRGGQVSVEIREGTGVSYGGFRLLPTQHFPDDDREAPVPPFAFDEKFYAEDAAYPRSLAHVQEIEMRGLRIAIVEVALARTNPAKGELVLYPDIGVEVRFGPGGFQGGDDYIDPRDRTLDDEPLWTTALLNAPVIGGNLVDTVRDRVRRLFEDILIVAPRAFEEAAEDLADWKRRLGYATSVSYTDEIGTTAAEIQEAIRNRYAWSRISYLILLGDAEHLPPHYRTRHPTGHSPRRMGTDLYYATMGPAGDLVPDIAYGRIPASTAAEAATVVGKIKQYESTGPPGEDFYRRAAIAAYFQDDGDDGTEDRLFTRTQEDLARFLEDGGRSPVRIFNTNSTDPRRWSDGTAIPSGLRRPGFPWDGDAVDITSAIARGSFIVTHRDHGSWDGWSDPPYSVANVGSLLNGVLLPVVFSINCQTGWFDRETDEEGAGTTDESFAERFLTRAGGGAVGVFAATRNSPSAPNDQLLRGMIDCIWPAFIPDYPGPGDLEGAALAGSRQLGWVLNYGKLRVISQFPTQRDAGDNLDDIRVHQRELEIYHCLGDPTMRLLTRAPLTFLAAVQAFTAFETEYTIAFPHDGARVAIVEAGKGGRTVGSGVVVDGEARIFLPADRPLRADGDYRLVASKEGRLPFEEALDVAPASTLECLGVPVGAEGSAWLGELGVLPDGNLAVLGAEKLAGSGDQMCCASGLVGTSDHLFVGHNGSGSIEMLRYVRGGPPVAVAGSPFGTKGGRPSHLAVDDAGGLLLASTADGLVEGFAISSTGLTPLAGSPRRVAGSARDLATWTTKQGTFLYVGSMDSPKGVHILRIGREGLEPLGTFLLDDLGAGRPGDDLEVAPTGGFLYVRDLDAGVFAFSMSASTGALTLIKGSPFDAGGFGSAIAVTRSETFLYAPAGTAKPEIACFRIGAGGGLTAIGRAPCPPVVLSLAVDRSDRFLLGASREGDGIARWKILADGSLEHLGTTPDGNDAASPAAVWVR